MSDYLVKCSCGKGTVVSEWAIGAPLQCRGCGKALENMDKLQTIFTSD